MRRKAAGFTIVELLIVIVVIGILAAIVIVAYNGVQARAQQSKMNADIAQLNKAIRIARDSTQKTMMGVTGSGYTSGNCVSKAAGTDLASLPQTDGCWVSYKNALTNITNASGVNVVGIVDPWGRPYFVDENEGESGGCGLDIISAYAQPFNGGNRYAPVVTVAIPLSGYSGCP
jgi:prepilin-type N-terminal cleavage/methylation domain-containing protein